MRWTHREKSYERNRRNKKFPQLCMAQKWQQWSCYWLVSGWTNKKTETIPTCWNIKTYAKLKGFSFFFLIIFISFFNEILTKFIIRCVKTNAIKRIGIITINSHLVFRIFLFIYFSLFHLLGAHPHVVSLVFHLRLAHALPLLSRLVAISVCLCLSVDAVCDFANKSDDEIYSHKMENKETKENDIILFARKISM